MAADEQSKTQDQDVFADAAPARRKKAEAEQDKPKKVRLTIHKDSNPHAPDPVFVGVNFVGYSIRRGEEVVVPIEVVNVLESAIETRIEQSGGVMQSREVPSYSFSVKPL